MALAARGAGVVLVGRDKDRLTAAADQVATAGGPPPLHYQADFSRLDDVHLLADKLRQRIRRIHVFASNAGLLTMRRHTTVDGYELTLQVNHLAGFLLAHLVREQLRGGRLIVTAADAHTGQAVDLAAFTPPVGWNANPAGPSGTAAYGASKSAGILFAREAGRRWPDLLATSFHPGSVRTRLGSGTAVAAYSRLNPLATTPEKAADTLVWLATAQPNELRPGGYYVKRTLKEPAAHAADPRAAAQLWDASLAAVGLGWR
jgi:NAD(P)-dependent dehydrogenase (short-subunit alcohol dehydrogenase family)